MTNYALEIDIQDFSKPLMQRIASHLDKCLKLARIPIQDRVRNEVRLLLEASPEYKSLLTGGKLQAELGLVEPDRTLPVITNIWLNSIVTRVDTVRAVGNGFIGGLSLVGIRGNYSDVLNSSVANFVSEGGFNIFWLGWLLSEGTRIIYKKYVVKYGSSPKSRTDLAVMIKIPGGRGWRVPPEYAGVIDDNFVTRALRGVNPMITEIIYEEVMRRL